MNFTGKILAIGLLITLISNGLSFPDNCEVKIDDLANILNAFKFSSVNPSNYSEFDCYSIVEDVHAAVEKFKNNIDPVSQEDQAIKWYREEITKLREELRRIPDEIVNLHATTIDQFSDSISDYEIKLSDKIWENNYLSTRWETLRNSYIITNFICSKDNDLIFAFRRDQCNMHPYHLPWVLIKSALATVNNSSLKHDCNSSLSELKNGLAAYQKKVIAASVRNMTPQWAALNDTVTSVKAQADSLRTYLKQKYSQNLDKLKDNLQKLVGKFEDLTKANELIIERRRAGAVHLAALSIACGAQSRAMKYVTEYKDDKLLLKDVIERAIFDIDQMENVVTFVQALPSSVLIDEAAQVIIKKLDFQTVSDNWSKKLLANNLRQINEFTNLSKYCVNYLEDLLPSMVRKAYAKKQSNAKKLANAIRSLTSINHQITGLEALLDEMLNNRHLDGDDLISVALLTILIYPDAPKWSREWSRLPMGVSLLLSGSPVKLWSRKHSYTLYGTMYGRIFSYPDGTNFMSPTQEWHVDRRYDNEAYFRFRNKANGRALYGDYSGHAYSRHMSNEYDEFWYVMAVHGAQAFYLKNVANGRVLDAGELRFCFTSSSNRCSNVHTQYKYLDTDTYQEWLIGL